MNIMTKATNADEFIAQQRQAIAQNPECGNSHYNLAVGLMGQQKYDEAEKALFDASGIQVVCNPLDNVVLQGRYDQYPRRRVSQCELSIGHVLDNDN